MEFRKLLSNELITGQIYMLKIGFNRKTGQIINQTDTDIILKPSGQDPITVPKSKIRFAQNADYQCSWTYSPLINSLMKVIGDEHIRLIYSNEEYVQLRNIIKDGSIFMNKITSNHRLEPTANRELMIDTTKKFYRMTLNLANKSIRYVNFHWCFYRSMSYGASVQEKIYAPVPFSTTSYFNITPNWLKTGDTCCLYKIMVPGNTPFVIVEPFYTPELRKNMSSDEWDLYEGEVVLLPGVLTVVKEDILQFVDQKNGPIDIKYLTCEYRAYTLREAINNLERIDQN